MDNSSFPEAAETAASDAALPTSSTPTPGDQETPGTPVTDLQIMPSETAVVPTLVDAKPIMNLPTLPQSIGLQQRQRLVLQAITMGKSIEEAARLADINPCTVYRWRKRDSRFIAAFNAWHAQTQESARACLIAANAYAARTVLHAVQNGHVAASLAVLKGMGTLAPQTAGPEIAAIVATKLSVASEAIKLELGGKTAKMRRKEAREKAEKKKAAEAAAKEARISAENSRRYFELYEQIPPLPRPITAEAVQQAVRASAHLVTTYPRYCSYTVTAVAGDLKPLATIIAQYNDLTLEEALGRLTSFPHRLQIVKPCHGAEEFARKLESLGATIEVRPGWVE